MKEVVTLGTPAEEVQDIIRVFPDRLTGEMVVDWNEKFDTKHFPDDLEQSAKADFQGVRWAVVGMTTICGSPGVFTGFNYLSADVSEGLLMMGIGAATGIGGYTGIRYGLVHGARRRILETTGGYLQTEQRRIRVPNVLFEIDDSLVGPDTFQETKELVADAFRLQDPRSPALVLSDKSPNKTVKRIKAARKAALLSMSKIREEQAMLGIAAPTHTQKAVKQAKHRKSKPKESIVFMPQKFVKKADPGRLEAVLPEMLGLVHALRLGSQEASTASFQDLARKLIRHSEREEFFADAL